MAYTPPDYNDINFVIDSSYTPPDYNDINFVMSEAPVGPTKLISYIDEGYDLVAVLIMAYIDSTYDLKPPLKAYIDSFYHMLDEQLNYINLAYGLKLGSSVAEYYGDSDVLIATLNEYYGDNPLLVRYLNEDYGDARSLISYIDELFEINSPLVVVLEQIYSLAGEPILEYINFDYELMLNNPAMSWMDLIYAINANSVIESSSLIVTLDDIRVYPFHVSFEFNRDSYKAYAEIHLADQESYLLAIENQSILRIQDGIDDLYFQVEVPREMASPGETTYMVPAESKSRALERAPGFVEEFSADLGSNVVADIAGRYGITVSWEIPDFSILDDRLYSNGETPLDVIRKITNAVKAKIQPTTEGNIRVVRNMDTDSDQWSTAAPTYYLTDQRNFFQTSEGVANRPGYNKYHITDHQIASYDAYLEYEDISATKKIVKGYRVPFTGNGLILGHSGGSWVTLEAFGYIDEVLTERVEIIQSTGRTQKPIYAMGNIEYKETVLGAITYNEDGTLTTEVNGQSLVDVTYTTRYWKWIATDERLEEVQFWIEEEEE